MLAGREFKKPYEYATNYLMEMLMTILDVRFDASKDMDRWGMHLRVTFDLHAIPPVGHSKKEEVLKPYDRFVNSLNLYEYKTVK